MGRPPQAACKCAKSRALEKRLGNCEIERARFVFRDANGIEREGSVVDVHLARR